MAEIQTQIAQMINWLLAETHKGPVFGQSVAFPELTGAGREALRAQVHDIAAGLEQQGYPDEVIPKAACFAPALSSGELAGAENTRFLTLIASAISDMYLADQLTDRGDEPMLLGIEHFFGDNPKLPLKLKDQVEDREAILHRMHSHIEGFASPGDAKEIKHCYGELVLHNEAKHFRLSREYAGLSEAGRREFLAQHADELAMLIVADAGFQSVTSSLYSLYRRYDTSLPTLDEVHRDPRIIKLLQTCNAVARIADERGDWWMDAGNNPEKGAFSINPFNEYHPDFGAGICKLAYLDKAPTGNVQAAMATFHDGGETGRATRGGIVTDIFFAHIRDYLAHDDQQALREQYPLYVQLCRRVMEISHVNMMGDIKMGGGDHPA